MTQISSKSRVFIVDDDETHRELLKHILAGAGYDPVAFAEGTEALTRLELECPDLILLDIDMPGMNGYEVCARIKSMERLASVPIIFISVLDETESKVRAFESGAVDYIPKPFHLEEVLARAGTHLQLAAFHSKLEANYKKLRETEAMRDNLTGMLIHDLRSPLAGLALSLEVLGQKSRADWNDRDLKVLSAARRTSLKLVEMVSSLLDVSRFEAGQMPMEKKRCDLREVAEAGALAVFGLIGTRSLEKQFPSEELPLFCDPEILQRVVSNLLANAFKYTPESSEVCLRLLIEDSSVRLEVVDQGVGIPPEFHERIFEKFGQVDASLASYSSGLGLTFCKLAVEAHGGRIGVVSAPGEGSTFWFSIPRQI
jgi:two-component system sensor histidine kinase/response regulator